MDKQDNVGIIADTARATKETLPKTVDETDGVFSTLMGWVNHVLLGDVKKSIATSQQDYDNFIKDLKHKNEKIPDEYKQEPKAMIVGPALEAMKYAMKEDVIKNMYSSLLTSSLDLRKNNIVHPSYVDIIKNMDNLDAKMFKFLYNNIDNYPIVSSHAIITGTNKIVGFVFPEIFMNYTGLDFEPLDIFRFSSSLRRLARFGIVDISFTSVVTKDEDYVYLEEHPELKRLFGIIKVKRGGQELEMNSSRGVLVITDYGKDFAEACL